jgi:hypothetical protein
VNAYEISLEVDGRAITRTEWATSAMDAFQMALLNQSAAELGMAKQIKCLHIGPPMAEVLLAERKLMEDLAAITERLGRKT